MAKWLTIRGIISDVDIIKEDPKALGMTVTEGEKFSIKLARKHLPTGFDIAETLIHELLHLWIDILRAMKIINPNKSETHHLILSIQHYASHVLKRSYKWKK